jgi:surface polysaccharide O-acyltransferase-like enzyme
MGTSNKYYNYCLDFIKGLACIFVVFMHCEFPGRLGIAVQAIGRFCVPFFFMVSGYFCFKPTGTPLNMKRKIGHIARIAFLACLFYLGFVLVRHWALGSVFPALTWTKIVNWVVFNVPYLVAGQYWFLFALLYTYLFFGILAHFRLKRFAYILAGVLFVIYITLAQGLHVAGVKVPNMFYRNWLVEAFPFFMLGHWIHEYQDRITLSSRVLLFGIICFTLLCLVERYLLGRDFGVNICTIPQVFAMFVYGVKNPQRHASVLQRLGRDCSMLVYILHPAVWHSLDGVYGAIGWSSSMPALYFRPVLVLGFSILFALLFNLIKQRASVLSKTAL